MTTYAPLHIVSDVEHQQTKPVPGFVQCPDCEKTFVGAAVVADDPYYSYAHGTYVRVRRAYCDHCNHLFLWVQACNAHGDRLGEVIPSTLSRIRNRPTIERFLRAYPEAAGVLQR